jgi:hypothetical protein
LRRQLEHPSRVLEISGEPQWAVDCLSDIGNDPVAPAADLVAEDPEASSASAGDRTFADDATPSPSPSGTGACSITKRPSGTVTSMAVW